MAATTSATKTVATTPGVNEGATPAKRLSEGTSGGTIYKEKAWDIGDGFSRWARGVSQPKFLITLVKPDWFTYVTGCHIKHVQVSNSSIEVLRVFHPGCEGISLIEGFLKMQIYALAEIGKRNRLVIYRADEFEDVLLAELKGQPDYNYVSVQFTKKDLLIVLTGIPHFKIIVWKWAIEQQLIAVSTLERLPSRGIAINGVNHHYWAEWSKTHLTFYELQEYTENNVTMIEIHLPTNNSSFLYPDKRGGKAYAFDLKSVTWTHMGELFVLNEKNEIYKVDVPNQSLLFIGQLDEFEPRTRFYELLPYDNSNLGALGTNGTFLIVKIRNGKMSHVKTIRLSSKVIKNFPITTAMAPRTSFLMITDLERTAEAIYEGKIRNSYNLTDVLLSQIQGVCFLGLAGEHVAVINEHGNIYILDAATGNIQAKWDFPFVATSIICHPMMSYVAVGTINGYIYYIDIGRPYIPKIIYEVYVMRSIIDKLEWMCRGRLLIAADSNEGYLFLLYGYSTTDFDYLDCAHVAGYIRTINVSSAYKDQRVQIISSYHINDEVPFLLNNFRLDSDYFDLISSQSFDAPISSICFSYWKQYQYAYTFTKRKIGLVEFSDDLQAGSLREPEILFNSDYPLNINYLTMKGSELVGFGHDGFTTIHSTPNERESSLKTYTVIQTHFPLHGGIREGIISLDGSSILAIGFDNTLTYIRIKPSELEKTNWIGMGFGMDFFQVVKQQRKYYAEKLKLAPADWPFVEGTKQEESNLDVDDGLGIIWKLNDQEEQEVLLRHKDEKEEMLSEISHIRFEIRRLMAGNAAQEAEDQLELEAFEINEEAQEDEEKDFEAKFLNMKIILSSLYELREEWIKFVTDMTFNKFETSTCRLKGFKFGREVENYVQPHIKNDFIQDVIAMKNTRRLERKLKRAANEIYLTGLEIHTKWANLENKIKKDRPAAKNLVLALSMMPAELQGQAREMLEDLETPALSELPTPPQPDFYQNLLKRLEGLKGRERRGSSEDEFDEDEFEEESDEEEDEGSREHSGGKGATKPGGPSVSKFEQMIAAAVAAEDATTTAAEEEEGGEGGEGKVRKRVDPELVKYIIYAAGIPNLSAQALAAQGKIPSEIAFQVRQDEIELAQHRRRRRRKYNPKKKVKVNQLVLQMRSGAGGGASARPKSPTRIIQLQPQPEPKSKTAKDKEKGSVSAAESKTDGKAEDGEEKVGSAESHPTGDGTEEEGDEEGKGGKPKKHRKVVTSIDESSGKEVIELVSDSSDESGAEQAEDDAKITEERAQAESALHKREKARYEAISRMLLGNLTWKLYAKSLVFYSQTELFSVQQTRGQMILIQAEIRKLQDMFNSVFQEAKEFKSFQMQSIQGRNQRIREISDFFGFKTVIEDVQWEPDEDVIQIFTVHDSEVPCERYLDAEGRRLAELARLEEEARRRAYDDFYERALITMMDGVLIKRREDMLKKDIPKPEFMLRKEQWEWNYEEYLKADEYYRAVEEHEQMRKSFRDELEMELRMLVKANRQTKAQFDNRLRGLFRYKLIIEKNIQMEELKWLRLQRHIFEYYRLQREYEMKKNLMKKSQEMMKYTQSLAAQIMSRVEDCSNRYEEILERDHSLEVSFREEMGPDVEKFHMEQFYKLYRKRPKLNVPRSQQLNLTIMMIKALQTPNLRWFAHENGELGQKAVNAIYEFDNPFFNPPSCPRSTWERFVHIRRQRLVCEYEAKAIASDLVELQSVLEETDDRIEEFSEGLAMQLAIVVQHRELILNLIHDVEMQLVMKHGKVELPRTQYYEDFEDAVLLSQKGVVKCNLKILNEGVVKMATLHKLKKVHKQLKNSEWKFKMIELTEKHLLIKERDILQIRVSKEILNFLQEHDDFLLVQEQKLNKVHQFQQMAEAFHKRFLFTRGKILKLFERLVAKKEFDNEEKDSYLDQRNLKVNIALNSCVRENPDVMTRFHEDRIQMLMRMGGMMRQIAKNASMVCQLEAELDRLYQKTYPVL